MPATEPAHGWQIGAQTGMAVYGKTRRTTVNGDVSGFATVNFLSDSIGLINGMPYRTDATAILNQDYRLKFANTGYDCHRTRGL